MSENRSDAVRELVKDPSLRVTDIAKQTGYNKGHVSRLRKESIRQELCRGEIMSENKNAKTSADGPVAWGCQCGRAYTVTCISSKPAKQEPVAWISEGGDVSRSKRYMDEMGFKCNPLYTAPSKQWVGLTDAEVSEIIDREIGFNSCWGPEEAFARAIEAKLREKNT